MPEYQCSIITPTGKLFDDKIRSLSAAGTSGSFGILAHHAPMVISLSNGPLTLNQNGKEIYFSLGFGVLEVNKDSDVLILVNSAEKASTYNDAKEKVRLITADNLN